jgi:hypothetical protein
MSEKKIRGHGSDLMDPDREEAAGKIEVCYDGDDDKKFEDWWEDRTIPEKVLVVIGFVILGIGLLFLFGYVVMLLWNWLMPEIFGLKTLTYWQAWGILALSCILFGRIGGTGSKSSSSDRKRKRKLRSYIREQCEEEGKQAETAKE